MPSTSSIWGNTHSLKLNWNWNWNWPQERQVSGHCCDMNMIILFEWFCQILPRFYDVSGVLQCIVTPLVVSLHLTVHIRAQKPSRCKNLGFQFPTWIWLVRQTLQTLHRWKSISGAVQQSLLRKSQVHWQVSMGKKNYLKLNLDPGSWDRNASSSCKGSFPGVQFL